LLFALASPVAYDLRVVHHTFSMAGLTGQALLDKIKELGDVAKDELARATGYVRTKKDGSESFRFTSMHEAIIEASTGIRIGGKVSGGKPGRTLSFVTTVAKSGAALVGKGYLEQLGAEVGDELDITVDAEAGTITLKLPPFEDEKAEEPVAA
jgi:hypothetical protein